MDQPYRFVRTRVFGPLGDPLAVQRVGMQEVYPAHEHDFIEIVLTVAGTGWQETATRKIEIKSGTVTVLRPGHWHAYLNCENLAIYNCCFGPELLRRELSWLIDDPRLAFLLWGTGDTTGEGPAIFHLTPDAVERLTRILDAFSEEASSSFGVKVSHLCLFLTSLANELPSPNAAGKMQPAVRKCIRLVEADLARAWSIRELAKEAGCSTEYLIRLFRASIGMTPYAYINRCRAERAASLLLRTDSTVGEVAELVGWPEPCHFARRFRQQYGTSASSYRAQVEAKASAAR